MIYAQLIIHHLELVAGFSPKKSTLSLQRLCPYYYRPAWQRGRVWQEGGCACMAGGVRVAGGCAWRGAYMAWQAKAYRQ